MLFSTAVCGLRCISFSLELCWSPLEAGGPNHRCPPLQNKGLKPLISQFYKLTAYCFYHPLFYNGPIMTYRDFSEQVQTYAQDISYREVRSTKACSLKYPKCTAKISELMYSISYYIYLTSKSLESAKDKPKCKGFYYVGN